MRTRRNVKLAKQREWKSKVSNDLLYSVKFHFLSKKLIKKEQTNIKLK